MKNLLLKSVLAVLCLLTFHTPALAGPPSSRFNGGYFGTSPTGPISRVGATIGGNYLYGTVFLRGIDTYDYLYFYGRYVDQAGNVRGSFSGYDYRSDRPGFFGREGGTFSGKVTGAALVLTFKTSRGSATVVLLKAMGYAPTFIAGRVVYFNDGSGTVYLYFDEKKVWTRRDYVPYTYRKTGLNTGTVSISGVGTAQLTFTDRWSGRIVGPGLNTTFDSYDYSDD